MVSKINTGMRKGGDGEKVKLKIRAHHAIPFVLYYGVCHTLVVVLVVPHLYEHI